MITTYTCPLGVHFPGDAIIGCGATFEGEPDEEGIVDCPACGMFWVPYMEEER